jgi:DNA replication protein DnaC
MMESQIPNKPMGSCELCNRPFEYEQNPAWATVQHLFKLNPGQGFWVAKEHPQCERQLAQRVREERDSRIVRERNAQIKREIHELGFSQVSNDKTIKEFRVEPDNKRAHQAITNWNYSQIGILLSGPPGRGKSHLMAAFANSWTEAGMNVVFQNTSLLLALLRRGYDDDRFDDRLRFVSSQVQILILDDLGAEKPTEWGEEKLYMIIDTRLRAKLPLFVTTNCTSKELENKFHPRILSRLRETCDWIEVGGRDWRAQIHQARERQ